MELIWYVWALAKTFLGLASTINSEGFKTGTRSWVTSVKDRPIPLSSQRLNPSALRQRSDTFHNLTVLSKFTKGTRLEIA